MCVFGCGFRCFAFQTGSPAVDVEHFREPGKQLDCFLFVFFNHCLCRRAQPSTETRERPFDTVSDGVCRELGHFAKPLSESRQMFREDFALDVAAYPRRGEI